MKWLEGLKKRSWEDEKVRRWEGFEFGFWSAECGIKDKFEFKQANFQRLVVVLFESVLGFP
jgi:hypothetical protein